jgi:hypothetical protein
MFFTTEKRLALALAGDGIEHPFEFLFSPDHVPTPFPETTAYIIQLLVPRRVSVSQRIEDVFTIRHELVVVHGIIPAIRAVHSSKIGRQVWCHSSFSFLDPCVCRTRQTSLCRNSHETPTCSYLPSSCHRRTLLSNLSGQLFPKKIQRKSG